MDAFESVVAEILWLEGYWVRTSYKVRLTPDDKRKINRPSSPRWELDVVAYSGKEKLLRVVECKSYLDSRGVILDAFENPASKAASRFKLFNDENLRDVVLSRLREEMRERCGSNIDTRLCLACGRIANDKDREG